MHGIVERAEGVLHIYSYCAAIVRDERAMTGSVDYPDGINSTHDFHAQLSEGERSYPFLLV